MSWRTSEFRMQKRPEANGVGPRRQSKLQDFIPIPRRVNGDRRLGLRHLRVLGAICGAVNNETGVATIRQERIAGTCGVPRKKVSAIVKDLREWGYLLPSKPTRKQGGHFKTLSYEILYETSQKNDGGDTQPCSLNGGTDRATSKGGTALPLSGGQESEYCESLPDLSHHHQLEDDGGEGSVDFIGFLVLSFSEPRSTLFRSSKPIPNGRVVEGARRLWEQVLQKEAEYDVPLRQLGWDQAKLAKLCAEVMYRQMYHLAGEGKSPPSSPLFCHISVTNELMSILSLHG